ncbi:uncharacterized protein LOC134542866 [Bacillus rossius redtenbacheri]|uniref:uncharacterized protein LOC134542866 n=1 Tax=Bacillus rossius redtenbacheri TaxID=93214 RepID=UPI002FDDD591
MTRFARARGSKASNEKVPEEATSWRDMRRQLLESQTRRETPETPVRPTWRQLLRDDTVNRGSQWATFEDNTNGSANLPNSEKKKNKGAASSSLLDASKSAFQKKDVLSKTVDGKVKKSKKLKVKKNGILETLNNGEKISGAGQKTNHEVTYSKMQNVKNSKKLKAKKNGILETINDGDCNFMERHEVTDSKMQNVKNSKKLKAKKNGILETINDGEDRSGTGQKTIHEVTDSKIQNVKNSTKLKAKKNGILKTLNDGENRSGTGQKTNLEVTDSEMQNVNKKQNNRKRKNLKKGEDVKNAQFSSPSENRNSFKSNKTGRDGGSGAGKKLQKKKKPTRAEKIESGKPYKRRKPFDDKMVMILNGKEIYVSKFNGFSVKTEDAERLNELKKKLRAKGIPEAEISAAMKLERRRAEKALARERKKVCFHCRGSGHVLSECPDLASGEAAGICYKCGSTEHKAFECRAGKTDAFRFATCFVCSEQGHISSQCPRNSRGLYPKGGGCHVCGEVTHLKKDCPRLQQQQESQTFTVGTLNGVALESLDSEATAQPAKSVQVKKVKHIKFV